MILKILDYRKSEAHSGEREEWTYFDNIETASTFFDEEIGATVVRCSFKGGNGCTTTFTIPHVAYLMSDAGKTIDSVVGRERDSKSDTEQEYKSLQDAAIEVLEEQR